MAKKGLDLAINIFEEKERDLAMSSGTNILIQKIVIGEYKINYAKAGQGFPLILLHGANIGWGQWHLNIAELAKNFTVYAPDLPGSGGSTKVDFRSVDLKRDFLDIVESFIIEMGLDKCHIVGHSLGGWIALNLAIRKESLIKKMVLVNPIGFSWHMPWKYRLMSLSVFAQFITKTAMKPTRDNMYKFLLSVLYKTKHLDPLFVDYFYEAVKRERITHPLMLIHRLSGMWKMNRELVLLDNLPNINQPTLIIIGDKDPLISLLRSDHGFKMIKGVKMEIFENTGHVPSMEKSERFNRVVTDFLIT